MPFEDFKRPWIITESSVACQPGEEVHIGGSAAHVLVDCGRAPYAPGKYFNRDIEKGKEERIEKEDEDKEIMYKIFFIEKNPKNGRDRIRADFGGGQIGGSWTAEDNTGETEEG